MARARGAEKAEREEWGERASESISGDGPRAPPGPLSCVDLRQPNPVWTRWFTLLNKKGPVQGECGRRLSVRRREKKRM